MERNSAIALRSQALEAIAQLTQLLGKALDSCDPGEIARIKRCVGMAIGSIQTDVLDVINQSHPDLDDLL